MSSDSIIHWIFLVFTGAALLSTLALYTRQSVLIAYILLGVCLGPYGMGWVNDLDLIQQTGDIGIIFLLFLLGLNLQPKNLLNMLKSTMAVTMLSSALFAGIGYGVGLMVGLSSLECMVLGATMMFSSTILGLKLLPTTVLHHQKMGEVVISILLLQDLIAIVVLLVLGAEASAEGTWLQIAWMVAALPGLIAFCLICERYVLIPLLARFDRVQEYIFLLALGWCLGVAELAHSMGLSYEIGAFLAGVAVASRPIALYISESLKPLRDFFLVLFFFALGATFPIGTLGEVIVTAAVLAVAMLILKPIVFWWLLRQHFRAPRYALEVGMRLGQISEFSLLVSYLALELGVITQKCANLIQSTTLITFIISSYYIVQFYPTPISTNDALRRD